MEPKGNNKIINNLIMSSYSTNNIYSKQFRLNNLEGVWVTIIKHNLQLVLDSSSPIFKSSSKTRFLRKYIKVI